MGFQSHFGPEDHDDPDDLAKFLLPPGEEDVVCQYRHTPDFPGVRYSDEQHTRLREGTHHLIMWSGNRELPDAPADGEFRSDGCQNPFDYIFMSGAQAALNGVGGIQDILIGDVPENEGAAYPIYPNTTRITAWINRAATGRREQVYEVFDWSEPLQAGFNSVDQNPEMNGQLDGAVSGPLFMDPGDTLGWECEIHNQSGRTLVFGNEAYTAEMCNIFGFAVPGNGGMWTCFR